MKLKHLTIFICALLFLSAAGTASAQASYPVTASSAKTPVKLPYPVYKPAAAAAVKVKKSAPVKKVFIMPGLKKMIKAPVAQPQLSNHQGVVKPVKIKIGDGEARYVSLSINSINRIITGSYIQNVKTSKTGDVSILIQGKNAYVQFTPIVIQRGAQRKTEYPTATSSAIFTTKQGIFTLIMTPENVPPQTIQIEQNGNMGTAGAIGKISRKGFSNFIASVLTGVYNGVIPSGFIKKNYRKVYKLNYEGVTLSSVKEYVGYKFRIYEFHLTNTGLRIISLSNREFLKIEDNPIAVSISNERIFPHTWTRLFIITLRRGK